MTPRTLKKALGAFVVPTFAHRYHVIAIRFLWKVLDNDIWRASEQINGKRRQMELFIEQDPDVLLFVSSLTAQEQGQETREKQTRMVMKNLVMRKMKKMYMKLIVMTLQTKECTQELLFGLLWTFPSLAYQMWKLTLQECFCNLASM